MERRNLRGVTLEVREVKMVGQRLLLPGKPAAKKHLS